MTVGQVIFYIFSAIAILSALGVLVLRNVLHATFLLVLSFFCVAAIYVFANASFIGVTQLLIYAGGIIVLVIFALMLTNKLNGKALLTSSYNWFTGVFIGVVFFLLLSKVILSIDYTKLGYSGETGSHEFIELIGTSLLTKHLIAFELAAILLLVALIGATVIATRKKQSNT